MCLRKKKKSCTKIIIKKKVGEWLFFQWRNSLFLMSTIWQENFNGNGFSSKNVWKNRLDTVYIYFIHLIFFLVILRCFRIGKWFMKVFIVFFEMFVGGLKNEFLGTHPDFSITMVVTGFWATVEDVSPVVFFE